MILDGRVRGFGRGGRVWGRPQKVNLGRKSVETEDGGNSSCEKLQAVLAVLLLVAVCQHTYLEIKIKAAMSKTEISDLQNIFPPRLVGHPGLGAYRPPDQPPVVATMLIVGLPSPTSIQRGLPR